ncbi:hypothetical protein JS528_04840 [Bifidobacterium sp. MA2]|uniref:CTP synthase n=1 Tax=Bifidobacterium santillanense TaxID=2809028 RepID=A0ABS5UP45_9BIFI|nr:hypothetical protein [Bifidobacterium santillanense]
MLTQAEQRRTFAKAERPGDRHLLDRRLGAGELVMPVKGRYIRKPLWDSLSYGDRIAYRLRTICREHPDWVLSGVSAAAIHRYTSSMYLQRYVHIAVTDPHQTGKRGLVVAHYTPDLQVVVVDGIRVTSPEQTMFDCARTLDFPTAMSICTMGLRATGNPAASLQDYCAAQRRKRGLPRARFVAEHVDPMCTNGGEAVSLAVSLELGFAQPQCQRQFISPIDGGAIYADFTWTRDDGSLVVGELDGREKYVNPAMTGGDDVVAVTLREKDRETEINMLNIPVVRFQMVHVRNRTPFEQRLVAAQVPRPNLGKRTPFTGYVCTEY